jgi:hypothetical protein
MALVGNGKVMHNILQNPKSFPLVAVKHQNSTAIQTVDSARIQTVIQQP